MRIGAAQISIWLALFTVVYVSRLDAAVTPELQRAVRTATFEVVMKKPDKDPLNYEKPLPLELLPYIERTDAYRSLGTAFALGNNTYVTAGHVLTAGVGSQYGVPQLRDANGKVHAIDRILKFSAHEDFAVFSVVGDPAKGLAFNRSPHIDDTVLAVGNALGEGIVIRDGLFTSETAEQQDGRWKWIRFSAAASPGNSGGPLLDESGAVMGVVIGKSASENLNYALPISRVLDAAELANFDVRTLETLPFLHGTRSYTTKTDFPLPKDWQSFAAAYLDVVNRNSEQSNRELLNAFAATRFPKGADALLYDVEESYDPRLIAQRADDQWTAEDVGLTTTELPGDGFVKVGVTLGITLFRLHRSNDASDTEFYTDSKAFMDITLKGLGFKRQVGTDAVQVTSLGAAVRDERYTDHYGRAWQQRVWALPYADAYIYSLLLPTPDGYVGIMQYVPSGLLSVVQPRMQQYADLFYVSYWGTVTQWQTYLARREWLPTVLRDCRLSAADAKSGLNLVTRRLDLKFDTAILPTDKQSLIGMAMSYFPQQSDVTWDVGGIWIYQDHQQKSSLVLQRQPKPVANARQNLRDRWDNMLARQAPYDGTVTRETADVFSATTIVEAPSATPGKVSSDLLYALTVNIGSYPSQDEMQERLQKSVKAVHVLEAGPGAMGPLGKLQSLKTEFNRLRNEVMGMAHIDMSRFGAEKDQRDRTSNDDIRDFMLTETDNESLNQWNAAMTAAVAQNDENAANTSLQALKSLRATQDTRANNIARYWASVQRLQRERTLWSNALQRNRLPADTPHRPTVTELETQLRSMTSGGPTQEWGALISKLVAALYTDRQDLVRKIGSERTLDSTIQYQKRQSQCVSTDDVAGMREINKPSTGDGEANNIGSEQSAKNPLSRYEPARVRYAGNPQDFYPANARRDLEEGAVVLSIRISNTGCPLSAAVIGSSGSQQLDDAAMLYYENLQYTPAQRNGHAMEAIQPLVVAFKLLDP